MKALNWALPQSNPFGIATLYPRPEPRQSTALAAAQDEVGRGFTVELIKNHCWVRLASCLCGDQAAALIVIEPKVAWRFRGKSARILAILTKA